MRALHEEQDRKDAINSLITSTLVGSFSALQAIVGLRLAAAGSPIGVYLILDAISNIAGVIDPDKDFVGRSWQQVSPKWGDQSRMAIALVAGVRPGGRGFGIMNISTKGLTASERELVRQYARATNMWLRANPAARIQSTGGKVRYEADKFADFERQRALLEGRPYKGVVGHVPDTAITGQTMPPMGWMDLPSKVNSKLGGGLSSRLGKRVDVITVDGVIP
jgi:hypothetical protein